MVTTLAKVSQSSVALGPNILQRRLRVGHLQLLIHVELITTVKKHLAKMTTLSSTRAVLLLSLLVSSSISEGEREEKRGEGKINRAGEAADNGQRRRIERERGKDLHLRASREDEDDSMEEGGRECVQDPLFLLPMAADEVSFQEPCAHIHCRPPPPPPPPHQPKKLLAREI